MCVWGGVSEQDLDMSFHDKPIKTHEETLSQLKNLHPHFLVSPLPLCPAILNWNPQMTKRFQTRRFNCQNAEFRFSDRACAVTSWLNSLPHCRPGDGGLWQRCQLDLSLHLKTFILKLHPHSRNQFFSFVESELWWGEKRKKGQAIF